MRKAAASLIVLTAALILGARSWALECTVTAPPVLSISSEEDSFTLEFSDFVKNSQTPATVITYRIQANNMAAGTVNGAVTARLKDALEFADLEVSFQSYSNLGQSSFATLSASQQGFVQVAKESVSLCRKDRGTGRGDRCLDGNLLISWRAKLNQDARPGKDTQKLIVTLLDGN